MPFISGFAHRSPNITKDGRTHAPSAFRKCRRRKASFKLANFGRATSVSAGSNEFTEPGRDAGKALDWPRSPGENGGSTPLGATGGVIVAKEAEDRLSEVPSTPAGGVPAPRTW